MKVYVTGELRASRSEMLLAPPIGGGSLQITHLLHTGAPVKKGELVMEFAPTDGSDGWMTPLAHRQFYPQELEALLHYNGFAITAGHGDFVGGPLASSSATMILHCRPRRRGS